MSWRPEVKISGYWEKNSCVFDTEQEALASAKNLFDRWTMAEDYRAIEVFNEEQTAASEGEKK